MYGSIDEERNEKQQQISLGEVKHADNDGRKVHAILILVGLLSVFLLVSSSGLNSKSAVAQLLFKKEQATSVTKLPNIIFYLIDDQGFGDMGYQGQDFAEFTPTLDAFAADGITLNRYYTEYVCTPSRSTLMTGKLPVQTGMQHSVPDMIEPWGVPTHHKFISEYLQEAGYSTHIVGKWHLGFATEALTPLQRGFESFYGFFYGKGDYYSHSMPRNGGNWYDMQFDGQPDEDAIGEYSTVLFEPRVQKVIEDHDKSKPLFLYYSQQLMHSPVHDPPADMFSDEDFELVEGLSTSTRMKVGKMSLAMDRSFEALIKNLKDNKMYENSYIIVASDNGGCTYDGTMNYPLRGEKNTVFEGGVRVNAFIHSPLLDASKRGTTYDNLFHVSDWFKSILVGIIGFDEEELERKGPLNSINQWDSIMKSDRRLSDADNYLAGPRTEILHNIETKSSGDIRGAIRIGNYKLIYGERDADWYTPESPADQNYCELVEETSTETWVFDISNDPYESNDLSDIIDDGILDELWTRFDYWYDNSAPSAFEGEDTSCFTKWIEYGGFMVPWLS